MYELNDFCVLFHFHHHHPSILTSWRGLFLAIELSRESFCKLFVISHSYFSCKALGISYFEFYLPEMNGHYDHGTGPVNDDHNVTDFGCYHRIVCLDYYWIDLLLLPTMDHHDMNCHLEICHRRHHHSLDHQDDPRVTKNDLLRLLSFWTQFDLNRKFE